LVYLDDWLLIAKSKESAIEDFHYVISILESLGFVINHDKSCGVPSQSIEHLGLIIDSLRLSFALPEDKLTKILTILETALSRKEVHLRLISSLIGNLVWAIPAFPLTQAITD
jgi:hypothetical protein